MKFSSHLIVSYLFSKMHISHTCTRIYRIIFWIRNQAIVIILNEKDI